MLSDLRRYGRKLVSDQYPDLEERFYQIDCLFGHLVFSRRITKGLTQEQLADLCGLATETIHRVEGGNANISMATYKTIFNKLGISAHDVGDFLAKRTPQTI